MSSSTPYAPHAHDAVVISGARTPFTRLLGELAEFSAVDLGAHAMSSALRRGSVQADAVDAVIMGQVVQAGCGQNPARQAAEAAGIPRSAPAETVNKVCLSGLLAVIHAARLIRLGEAQVVVAGGMESMSQAPHLLPGSRRGWKYGDFTAKDALALDGLTDAAAGESMGALTERGNAERGFARKEQDAIAATSHQRAAAHAEQLAREIAPIEWTDRQGRQHAVSVDEGIRPDASSESMSRLRPAFNTEGTITAGNSSPLSDGAAALVVTSRAWAEEHQAEILATIGECGQVAGPDHSLHSQPSNAIASALERAGWRLEDVDVVEINEAFASISLQSHQDLGLSPAFANAWGGAIALGHPLGASGARLALTACYQLVERGGGNAAAALCGGGGQGEALLLSR